MAGSESRMLEPHLGEEMAERVADLVDLDRFYDSWVLRVMLTHADGYTRQANSFFVYRPGARARFTFIPWGIEEAILYPDEAHAGETSVPPGVGRAEGALARRLCLYPTPRDRYLERLRTLLDEV